MTAIASPPVTAQQLRELLAVRYQPPEWRLEHEVTLNGRRLDSVALCMWGGRGRAYQVLGFELKVSRADWLRELATIEKAADWAQVVDRFFVVAPRGVVLQDELPRDWGLLELTGTGSGLRLKAQPAQRSIGETLPRELVARILDRDQWGRRGRDFAERERIQADADTRARSTVASELEELRATADRYHRLMRDAGLSASQDPVETLRTARRIASALSTLEHAMPDWVIDRIAELATRTTATARELQSAVAAFRAPLTTPPPEPPDSPTG